MPVPGATKRAWDGIDQPLEEGGWPLISASAQQYLPGVSQMARAATRAEMDQVYKTFLGDDWCLDKAGFDWLELHCAHGYFLSSFISPLTNQRQDEYGWFAGKSLPLSFGSIRRNSPSLAGFKPISVRISANTIGSKVASP